MRSGTRQRHTRNEVPGDKQAIVVRLPVAVHKALVDRAEREKRSVNAHVTYLIEHDLQPEELAA